MTTTTDTLERRLESALAAVPAPEAVARLDLRIQRAIAAETLRGSRWSPMPAGRRTLVLGLLLVAGAVSLAAGGSTLVERLFQNSPSQRTQWELAERLGLGAMVGGHEVTLERAYLDANLFMMAFSSSDGFDPSIEVWVDGRTPDDWGVRWAGAGYASGRVAEAKVDYYSAPGGVGPVAQVVVQLRRHGTPPIGDPSTQRPGRLAFALPNHGGGRWTGTRVDAASGVRASLDALVVAPTSIVGHMSFDVSGFPVSSSSSWSSTGMELVHAGDRIQAGIGLKDDGTGTFNTMEGVGHWAGTWTVRVDALERFGEAGQGAGPAGSAQPRIETIDGPWVFKVTLDP